MKHLSPIASLRYGAVVGVAFGCWSGSAASLWEGSKAQGTPTRGSLQSCRQLPTGIVARDDPLLPEELRTGVMPKLLPMQVPGRRVPPTVAASALAASDLVASAVPLTEANTLAHFHFQQRRFGRVQTEAGREVLFNPGVLLVQFRQSQLVSALGVPANQELECAHLLAGRSDISFVELDTYQRRLYRPNDPLITNQWHHQKIGSYTAWNQGLGRQTIQIAIVDTPFQMNHPDLAANTLAGWDAVANIPVTSAAGIDHSTLSAGMAAAVIGNDVGVAGAGNCALVPINIDGSISGMYDAVIWAADHAIRLVNISWTGGDSPTLNRAGTYLKTNSAGILAMAGGNLPGDVDPNSNQPDIWCISMTDAADLVQSESGMHIDFAAPGYLVYSTTTNSTYSFCTGTSFSTPLFCGVAAVLMSINPTLTGDDVIGILKSTAADLGPPGWDSYYGWGRIDFAAAASAAAATLPTITGISVTNRELLISATFNPALAYSLWSATTMAAAQWSVVTNAVAQTNGDQILFRSMSPASLSTFYRVGATR